MKYKAIITDLDGTAVDSPDVKLASDRLANAVDSLEERGVKVIAATGRAESFARVVLKSMRLRHPCIVSSGTRIIDPNDGRQLWMCGLEKAQIDKIVNVLRETNYGFLWNDSNEDDYLNGGWSIDEFENYNDCYFFEVCFVPFEEREDLLLKLRNIPNVAATVVVAQKPDMFDIHITNEKATKEHAIRELEKIIGVKKSEIIGVGDGHNDLHLFNGVGYKVAMGNAVEEVKSAADEVVGEVKDEGLAEYFERLAKDIKNGG